MSKKRVMPRDIRANPLPINRNAYSLKGGEFAACNLALAAFQIIAADGFAEISDFGVAAAGALAQEFDLTVRLSVPEAELRARLTHRWETFGIAPAEITRRVEENDLPNGRLLLKAARAADLVVTDFS